jgi:hypothetical protein
MRVTTVPTSVTARITGRSNPRPTPPDEPVSALASWDAGEAATDGTVAEEAPLPGWCCPEAGLDLPLLRPNAPAPWCLLEFEGATPCAPVGAVARANPAAFTPAWPCCVRARAVWGATAPGDPLGPPGPPEPLEDPPAPPECVEPPEPELEPNEPEPPCVPWHPPAVGIHSPYWPQPELVTGQWDPPWAWAAAGHASKAKSPMIRRRTTTYTGEPTKS